MSGRRTDRFRTGAFIQAALYRYQEEDRRSEPPSEQSGRNGQDEGGNGPELPASGFLQQAL